jgi:hypothetical protein
MLAAIAGGDMAGDRRALRFDPKAGPVVGPARARDKVNPARGRAEPSGKHDIQRHQDCSLRSALSAAWGQAKKAGRSPYALAA